jgi:hypothetical protein
MHIGKALTPETTLRRYLTTDKFLDILLCRRMFVGRMDGLEDQFECEYTRQLCDEFNRIIVLRDGVCVEGGVEWYRKKIMKSTCVLSWTLDNNENMALWRLYGKVKNCLAIETTVALVKEILSPNTQVLSARIEKVKYIDHFTHEFYKELLDDGGAIDLPRLKNCGYRFEDEARIIYSTPNHAESHRHSKGWILPVDDVGSLVNRVVVGAESDNYYFDYMKDLINKIAPTIPVEWCSLRHPPRMGLNK